MKKVCPKNGLERFYICEGIFFWRETTDASLADLPSEAERTLTYQKKRFFGGM